MKTWFRIYLVVASVSGGLLGATLILLRTHTGGWSNTAIIFGVFEMYGFVAVSGCVFAADWRKGHLLLIALAMQVPYVSSPEVTYKFGVGFHLFILGGPDYLGFDVLFGSVSRIGHTDDAPWRIGINVVALAAFILLFRTLDAYERNLKSTPGTMKNGIDESVSLDPLHAPDPSLAETISSREDSRSDSDHM